MYIVTPQNSEYVLNLSEPLLEFTSKILFKPPLYVNTYIYIYICTYINYINIHIYIYMYEIFLFVCESLSKWVYNTIYRYEYIYLYINI